MPAKTTTKAKHAAKAPAKRATAKKKTKKSTKKTVAKSAKKPATKPAKKAKSSVAKTSKPAAALASKSRVTVRTYRHGLGDCHLIGFAKEDGSRFHILIDCGVVNRTKNPEPLMTAVAQDIGAVTGGVLDLVVATHQHTDHLSGFKQAASEFDESKMTMKRLWLAWTEDPKNKLGRKIQKELIKKLNAVRIAATRLAAAGNPASDRIKGILDFFSPGIVGEDTQEILDMLQSRSDAEVSYHAPGELLTLPDVPNVRVYVLGPPTDPAALKVTNPRKSKHEGYEEAELAASASGLVNAIIDSDAEQKELSHPFDAKYRLTQSNMSQTTSDFFAERYFGKDATKRSELKPRQIETSWLEGAEELALALGDYTNNTSLALAFEFIDTGEVLLFPGDAQIGSWNTWPLLEWTIREGTKTRKVRIGDLLARTVFYKVSHHASHNGTLSGLAEGAIGFEQMTHRDLVCVVPVDVKMSKAMNWDRTLPWQPLLDRMVETTRGRLLFTDQAKKPPEPANLTSLSAAERKRFAEDVLVTKQYIEYRR